MSSNVRQQAAERSKGRRWFLSLRTSDKWELGDQLVDGSFDWRDWFARKPSAAFMSGADNERMMWESEEEPVQNPRRIRPNNAMLEWIVGRLHVSESDKKVEKIIRSKLKKPKAMSKAEFEKEANKMVSEAIKIHHRNQDLYHSVMTGRF